MFYKNREKFAVSKEAHNMRRAALNLKAEKRPLNLKLDFLKDKDIIDKGLYIQ